MGPCSNAEWPDSCIQEQPRFDGWIAKPMANYNSESNGKCLVSLQLAEACESPSSSEAKVQCFDSPPSTPKCQCRMLTPSSPPSAPHMVKMPPLMKAIHGIGGQPRIDAILEALESDPEAARLPFFDHSVEPPLCCAVRLGCNDDVLQLLLDYGADVHADNVHGQGPLALLCKIYAHTPSIAYGHWLAEPSQYSWRIQDHKNHLLAVAAVLLHAGADPMDFIETEVGRKTCLEHACSIDNDDLLQLLLQNCPTVS